MLGRFQSGPDSSREAAAAKMDVCTHRQAGAPSDPANKLCVRHHMQICTRLLKRAREHMLPPALHKCHGPRKGTQDGYTETMVAALYMARSGKARFCTRASTTSSHVVPIRQLLVHKCFFFLIHRIEPLAGRRGATPCQQGLGGEGGRSGNLRRPASSSVWGDRKLITAVLRPPWAASHMCNNT